MKKNAWLFWITVVLAVPCLWADDGLLKVASYNLFFLDEGISATRRANIQAVLNRLDSDVIAFQEIKNETALRNILPEEYAIALLDEAQELQNVALAVRKPYVIEDAHYVFPRKEDDWAFPRSRNLLEVRVAKEGQPPIYFLVHHAKSRSGGRLKTDSRRELAASMIVTYIQTSLKDKPVILLGDFNDTPHDRSLNILESGDIHAQAGPDTQEDTFLINILEPLHHQDYCSFGHYLRTDLPTEGTFSPIVPGAMEENEKWRGKEYNYWKDIPIKEILFDMVLLTPDLAKKVKDYGMFTDVIAAKGTLSEADFKTGTITYTVRGDAASDHIPVWVKLKLD